MTIDLEGARELADAVLLEGYFLHPYRVSSKKNRDRWTFSVLAPRAWSERDGGDPWWMEAQCLVEGTGVHVRGRLRFLQVLSRRVEARGRGVSEKNALEGAVLVRVQPVEEFEGTLHRVDVRVQNLTPCANAAASRSRVVKDFLASTHLLLEVAGDARFCSASWCGRYHYYFVDEIEPRGEDVES